MSWEIVALVALGATVALVVWRETRRTRTTKLSKSVKLLQKSLAALETRVLALPDAQVMAELEEKLKDLEQKTGASPTAALKALVDRVNTVSTDATEMKTALVDVANRMKRLETGSTWRRATGQEEDRG